MRVRMFRLRQRCHLFIKKEKILLRMLEKTL